MLWGWGLVSSLGVRLVAGQTGAGPVALLLSPGRVGFWLELVALPLSHTGGLGRGCPGSLSWVMATLCLDKGSLCNPRPPPPASCPAWVAECGGVGL